VESDAGQDQLAKRCRCCLAVVCHSAVCGTAWMQARPSVALGQKYLYRTSKGLLTRPPNPNGATAGSRRANQGRPKHYCKGSGRDAAYPSIITWASFPTQQDDAFSSSPRSLSTSLTPEPSILLCLLLSGFLVVPPSLCNNPYHQHLFVYRLNSWHAGRPCIEYPSLAEPALRTPRTRQLPTIARRQTLAASLHPYNHTHARTTMPSNMVNALLSRDESLEEKFLTLMKDPFGQEVRAASVLGHTIY
jgi:hypothetical protein